MFYIPSGSMLPTLQIGDRIVVDKLSYRLHGVHRGDIVVFRRPPLEHADYSDLVKRVIGLPGDTISSADGRVYHRRAGRWPSPGCPRPVPTTAPSPLPRRFSLNHPYTVPAGEYFVMGDNRTDSEDSRYFGPIPANLMVGKMAFVVVAPRRHRVAGDPGRGAAVVLVVAIVLVAQAGPTAGPGPPDRRARGPPVPGTT